MAVAITGISRIPTGYSFAWSGAASCDVYLRGEIYTRGATTSPIIVADNLESGYPDVVFAEANAEPPLGTPYVALQWRSVAGCDGYVVSTVVGATATQVAAIPASAAGYVTWKSAILADGAAANYTVTAKTGTAESPVHSVACTVIRNPRVAAIAATATTAEGVTTLTFDLDPYAGII